MYPTKEGRNGTIYLIAEGIKVIPRSDGYWSLDVHIEGKRQRRNFDKGDEGLEKAIKASELLAAKLRIPSNSEASNEKPRLFEVVAAEYLTSNRSRWTVGTLDRYRAVIRDFINPALGKKPLEKVSRGHIKDMLVDILAIRSAKTVELIHAVVSGIFSEAIDRGYTERNPANGLLKKVLPPKHKRTESTPDPFSKDELNLLLLRARQSLPQNIALVIETLAYSGMRLGEVLAMHADHLDPSNLQYMVSETVRNGIWGLPKTGKRLIDLPASLVELLEAHIKAMRRDALRTRKDVGHLFPTLTQRIVQGSMKRTCKLARLRVRSPHDLRHTYASLLLMDHYSPAYVQKQLGHHSITMTCDIYGHWIPGEGKRNLDQTFGGRKLQPRSTLKLATGSRP